MTIGYVIGYLLCCILSFWIMQTAWRYKSDLTIQDAIFIGFMSLMGPVSVICAVVLWVIEFPGSPRLKNRIILPRKN